MQVDAKPDVIVAVDDVATVCALSVCTVRVRSVCTVRVRRGVAFGITRLAVAAAIPGMWMTSTRAPAALTASSISLRRRVKSCCRLVSTSMSSVAPLMAASLSWRASTASE